MFFLFLSFSWSYLFSSDSWLIIQSDPDMEKTSASWVVVSNTVSDILSLKLLSNKKELLDKLANSYNEVYSNYQSLSSLKSWNYYDSLLCLNLISEDTILNDLDSEVKTLKNNLLQEFILINSSIFSLENKYNEWLIGDVVYNLEKHRLDLKIQSFYSTYFSLFDEIKKRYISKIDQYLSNYQWYLTQNKSLLTELNKKIMSIKDIIWTKQLLIDWVLELKWIKQPDIMKKIQVLTDTSIFDIKKNIDSMILNYPNIKSKLIVKRDEDIAMFKYKLDRKFKKIFWNWYNQDDYNDLISRIDLIQDSFFDSNWKIQCSNILSTNIDLNSYFYNIKNDSNKIMDSVNEWLNFLWKGDVDKKQLTSNLSEFNIFFKNYSKQILQDFRIFINKNISEWKNDFYTKKHKWDNVFFDKPYLDWEFSENIKALQEILVRMWYSVSINWRYDSFTKDAIYKMQLKAWLLKWYENKPEVFWYFWPATRKFINKKIVEFIEYDRLNLKKNSEKEENYISKNTDNVYVKYLLKFSRNKTQSDFFNVLDWLNVKIDSILLSQNLDFRKKLLLRNLKSAILDIKINK